MLVKLGAPPLGAPRARPTRSARTHRPGPVTTSFCKRRTAMLEMALRRATSTRIDHHSPQNRRSRQHRRLAVHTMPAASEHENRSMPQSPYIPFALGKSRRIQPFPNQSLRRRVHRAACTPDNHGFGTAEDQKSRNRRIHSGQSLGLTLPAKVQGPAVS